MFEEKVQRARLDIVICQPCMLLDDAKDDSSLFACLPNDFLRVYKIDGGYEIFEKNKTWPFPPSHQLPVFAHSDCMGIDRAKGKQQAGAATPKHPL
jgi:hypothetical protein